MSVYRDMAIDAGMTPYDEAARYIEEQHQRAEYECAYAGHDWQDAGGGMVICAVCFAEEFE